MLNFKVTVTEKVEKRENSGENCENLKNEPKVSEDEEKGENS